MEYEEFKKEVARLSDGKDCSLACKQKLRGKYLEDYTPEEFGRILKELHEMTFEEYQTQWDYEIIGVYVYNEDFSNALDNPLLAREDCIHIEMRSSKHQQSD